MPDVLTNQAESKPELNDGKPTGSSLTHQLGLRDWKMSNIHWKIWAKDALELIDRQAKQLKKVTCERDLAIAHDRQPYPTAQAYEKTCAILHKKEELLKVEKKEVRKLCVRIMELENECITETNRATDNWEQLEVKNAQIERLKGNPDAPQGYQ